MELPPPDWPAHGPEPLAPIQHPVRPDAAHLGATEDVDREPDGVPHAVVGATAGFSVVLAILLASLWFVSDWTMRAFVVALLVLAVPVIVTSLKHKADRERSYDHPSR